MDQNIKNRLVGIIVIFALAVVFLPMILDGSGVRKDKFEVVIPPPPAVDANPEFDTRIIELNAEADAIPELEQRFVDEVSSAEQVAPEPAIKVTSAKESSAKKKAGSEVARATASPPSEQSWAEDSRCADAARARNRCSLTSASRSTGGGDPPTN